MALHAVAYCERLFYLEEVQEIDEVEEIRIADERVYAGRILHQTLPDDQPLAAYVRESERLGIRGKFDALKRQDVAWWWCSTNAGVVQGRRTRATIKLVGAGPQSRGGEAGEAPEQIPVHSVQRFQRHRRSSRISPSAHARGGIRERVNSTGSCTTRPLGIRRATPSCPSTSNR